MVALTVYFLLFGVWCLVFVVCCLLFVVCCLLFVVFCSGMTAYCLLTTFSLFGVQRSGLLAMGCFQTLHLKNLLPAFCNPCF